MYKRQTQLLSSGVRQFIGDLFKEKKRRGVMVLLSRIRLKLGILITIDILAYKNI